MAKHKIVLVSVLSLSFLVVASSALATMTFNSNTITSDGALNITPTGQPVTVNGSLWVGSPLSTSGGYFSSNSVGLYLDRNFTALTAGNFGTARGIYLTAYGNTDNITGGSLHYLYGMEMYVGYNGTLNDPDATIYGIYIGGPVGSYTGTVDSYFGVASQAIRFSAGNSDMLIGLDGSAGSGFGQPSGTITEAYGVRGSIYKHGSSGATFLKGAAFYAPTPAGLGAIETYGLLIEDISAISGATTLQAINYADKFIVDSNGNITSTGTIRVSPTTFASLGTCNSGAEGKMKPVTDSNTGTWGATVAGGGANHILAYCNGTNWTVAAK